MKSVAVAARSLETAKVFSEKLNIPQAIEGYESLAKCENIDIVYVGVINTGHFEHERTWRWNHSRFGRVHFAILSVRIQRVKPTKFLGSGYLNVNNVDESANAIIQYPGKATAVISTTSVATFSNEATIIGTKGAIKIPMFWCPTKMEINDETFEFELPKSQAEFNFFHSTGLSYEAEECRRCIKDGLLESPHMSHEESLGYPS